VPIWLDNKLGKDLMPLNILSKFGDNQMKIVQIREQTKVKCKKNPAKFKGHNSKVPNVIWLDIELDQNVMPINILGKFDDCPMKNV